MDKIRRENIKHQLKTINPFYTDMVDGYKNFECRLNDRDFKVGDILILSEWHGKETGYSGSQIEKRITYILSSFVGLKKNYVVLGLDEILI